MVKNPAANAGDPRDVGLIPEWGRSPGIGNDNPLQNACLENPMDRGAWRATVLGATKSDRTEHTHTVGSLSLIITHSSSSTSISFSRKMIRCHNINMHTISFKLQLDTC